MGAVKDYIKLLRVKHYIKNAIVYLPLFFSGAFVNGEKFFRTCLGFVSFCFISSAVYILNDYRDMEKDRKHPTKCNRPLASGRINSKTAMFILVICIFCTVLISIVLNNLKAMLVVGCYFFLNVAYSMGLKNRPIVDVVILASGFVLRVLYGGFIAGILISKWLYLVVTTGSLFMGLGKRRNELKGRTDSRTVLRYYNEAFLDKNMYVCVALTIVFYSLWTLEIPNTYLIWTVPVFIIMLMSYSLDIEGDSDGDPIEVILKDKLLLVLGIGYTICLFIMIYYFGK